MTKKILGLQVMEVVQLLVGHLLKLMVVVKVVQIIQNEDHTEDHFITEFISLWTNAQ